MITKQWIGNVLLLAVCCVLTGCAPRYVPPVAGPKSHLSVIATRRVEFGKSSKLYDLRPRILTVDGLVVEAVTSEVLVVPGKHKFLIWFSDDVYRYWADVDLSPAGNYQLVYKVHGDSAKRHAFRRTDKIGPSATNKNLPNSR